MGGRQTDEFAILVNSTNARTYFVEGWTLKALFRMELIAISPINFQNGVMIYDAEQLRIY
jgi:hypothetical protein